MDVNTTVYCVLALSVVMNVLLIVRARGAIGKFLAGEEAAVVAAAKAEVNKAATAVEAATAAATKTA